MIQENIDLSIVVPSFNEEESVGLFFNAIAFIQSKLPAFEIIFVDDGSTDQTVNRIRDLSVRAKEMSISIVLVRLTRNFGHQIALLAGMKAARGDMIVTIDCDLQDPIEVIPEMIRHFKNGFPIVLGQRIDRSTDTFFKKQSANIFYKLLAKLTAGEFPAHVGDFRLIGREVAQTLCSLREASPYWRGLVIWTGYPKAIVPYARAKRQAGETKYSPAKMIKLAFNAIFSFSRFPLSFIGMIGAIVSAASLLFGLTFIVLKLMGVVMVAGWPTLVSLITFIGGIQLIALGIIGQYVGRIYEQSLHRPLYLQHESEKLIERN